MKELALLLMMAATPGPSLTIEPTPLSEESDAFTFWAMDSRGLFSNIATVTVLSSVLKGGPRNDTLVATDPENDVLLFHIVAQGTKGEARILNDHTGEFVYTPHRFVTLNMSGGPGTLQRSTDLSSWADINVFLTATGSYIDKRVASQQFYRLLFPIDAPTVDPLKTLLLKNIPTTSLSRSMTPRTRVVPIP